MIFCQIIAELSVITAGWSVGVVAVTLPQVAFDFLPFMKSSRVTGPAVAALSFPPHPLPL